MKFKQLKIEQEQSWFKRTIQSPHTKKSVIYIITGAIIGFLFFYLSEGKNQEIITTGEVIKSLFIGGFFGFFITNSPCARGRC